LGISLQGLLLWFHSSHVTSSTPSLSLFLPSHTLATLPPSSQLFSDSTDSCERELFHTLPHQMLLKYLFKNKFHIIFLGDRKRFNVFK
jgi:hypothetical protein